MAMHLRVRNFLGIKEADIDLEKIVLVGGDNAAGKSSLIEALACAASMSFAARGFTTKKAAAALLHEGAAAGSVSLRYDGGSIVVAYPGADMEQSGRAVMLGTRLALGATRFMDLKPPERMAEITSRYQTTPTEADVWDWFRTRATGITVLDTKIKETIGRIDDSGWDAVHLALKEDVSQTKGRWSQVTGVRWGSKVGDEWCPDNLYADEEYLLSEEQEHLAKLEQRVDRLMAAGAGSRALADQRKELASRLPQLRAQLDAAKKEQSDLQDQSERNVLLRARHADSADAHNALKCPHCSKGVRLIPSPKDPRGVLEALPVLRGEDIAAAREIVARVDEEQAVVLNELRRLASLIASLTSETLAAERAETGGAAAGSDKVISKDAEAELQATREELRAQADKITSILALGKARAFQAEIKALGELVEATGPDGVRLTVLKSKMKEINETLAEISTMAGFKPVVLEAEELAATYGGRAYALLSESERWRVNVVMSVLLYEVEQCRAPLLIDRLDVLHPAARVGPLKMLKARNISAVITQTTKDRSTMPNLPKAKFGTVYWLEDGVLMPFTP